MQEELGRRDDEVISAYMKAAAADPMRLILTSMRWRTLDGLLLLVIAAAAVAACTRLL